MTCPECGADTDPHPFTIVGPGLLSACAVRSVAAAFKLARFAASRGIACAVWRLQ